MTGATGSTAAAAAAWDAGSLVQLRDDLKLSPGQRLAIAEALLTFAIRTPHYTPKADPLPRF